MRFRLFLVRKPVVAVPATPRLSLEQCQVVVHLPEPCLDLLRKQLDIDIDAKSRLWSPIPFETLELIRIERLINRHSDSKQPILPGDLVRYTHDERKLIVRYIARYRLRAKESGARMQFLAYELLMANLLECSILLPTPV